MQCIRQSHIDGEIILTENKSKPDRSVAIFSSFESNTSMHLKVSKFLIYL